ncbi:DUF3613 domain-containing protein [Pseudomonas capsici]|uniref:DUF3613 domain-containing protein n=1 Tax=Pseudomonas capsici TaxID=2810614 RepID=A0ABT3C109_9PSED|nr:MULTISPECIES: DUF3613 domain-containing protein [Pseudomonas]MBN6716599.1 DUF3613 domain-containing protein [Pseudomonas capsici]MBN6721517.1 DUF3613 domain-containing protein [Pseudomonas capsici]MBN6726515.1 DUF3613 domain-containing protein [Pseudomonas capsici]MBX8477612.1 DUF3613 domain-containing protein [Pseudomonas cichorii]MBX8609943.1 DUF3613 domain-containing protein [Pseudomonas cichorii]
MKRIIFSGILVFGLCGDAWAIDEGPSSKAQKQTEAWLQLQARGDAASPTPQTVTPAERDLSLQRWINSYKHEIPEFYEQKEGGSISSGGK